MPCEDVGFLPIRHGTTAIPDPEKEGDGLLPGIYYGGIEITDGDMAPGIYIMAGGGFKVNSNDPFIAEGVFRPRPGFLFFPFTCCSGDKLCRPQDGTKASSAPTCGRARTRRST